jgi:hypothetical protein
MAVAATTTPVNAKLHEGGGELFILPNRREQVADFASVAVQRHLGWRCRQLSMTVSETWSDDTGIVSRKRFSRTISDCLTELQLLSSATWHDRDGS